MLFSSVVPFSCPVSKALLGLPHLTKMRTLSNTITHILITDRIMEDTNINYVKNQ